MEPAVEQALRGAHGDPVKALGNLIEQNRPSLVRMIELRVSPKLKRRLDPDDVIQEACVRAHQRFPKYMENPSLPFAVWLRLLTRQSFSEILRKILGELEIELSLEFEGCPGADSATLSEWLADTGTTPSTKSIRNEVASELRRLLDELDPIDREVIAMRYFDEIPYEELALILSITPENARMRVCRALKRLKPLLERVPGLRAYLVS